MRIRTEVLIASKSFLPQEVAPLSDYARGGDPVDHPSHPAGTWWVYKAGRKYVGAH